MAECSHRCQDGIWLTRSLREWNGKWPLDTDVCENLPFYGHACYCLIGLSL